MLRLELFALFSLAFLRLTEAELRLSGLRSTFSTHSKIGLWGTHVGDDLSSKIGRLEPDPASRHQVGDPLFKERHEPNLEIVVEDPVDARHVAFLLFSFTILAAIIFAMTQTSVRLVAPYTLLAIENIVAIFVAVMMFQALDDLTDQIVELHSRTLSACIHASVWVVVCAVIAWYLRNEGRSLEVCCACGAQFVSFFSLHAALIAQEHYFAETVALCLCGLLAAITILTCLGLLSYFAKRAMGAFPSKPAVDAERRDSDHVIAEWVEKVDEVEDHFAAMACSVMLTMLVRFIILGRYPPFHGIKPGTAPLHTESHRFALLAYASALVLLTMCVMPFLSRMIDGEGYIVRRLGGFGKLLLTMSIAWSFLLWGQWEIYERHFHWSPMFARIAFSCICTVAMICGLIAIAFTSSGRARFVGIHALALITGFAWEENFNHSLDVVLLGQPSKHLWKFAVAIGVAVIIMPIWAVYLKPLTMKLEMVEARHERTSLSEKV